MAKKSKKTKSVKLQKLNGGETFRFPYNTRPENYIKIGKYPELISLPAKFFPRETFHYVVEITTGCLSSLSGDVMVVRTHLKIARS